MAYLPAPTPPGSPLPALALLQAGGGLQGSSQTPRQVPVPGGRGAWPPAGLVQGGSLCPPPIPRDAGGPAERRAGAFSPPGSRCRLSPLQLIHPGPRGGAEPGSVGWGHRARQRGRGHPHAGRGPRWQRQGQAAAPCSKVQRIHRLGGGQGVTQSAAPPRKIPSPPLPELPPQRKWCQVQEPRRGCVGAHSPTAPAAPSRVPWPDAVVPPGLPQPPARSVGAGVSAALQGGREGGAQRGALQGHLL